MFKSFYVKILLMSEQLNEMLFIFEDAYRIRQARMDGDPLREPDETTLEDVVEAMLQREKDKDYIFKHKDSFTGALRYMLHGIDQQG